MYSAWEKQIFVEKANLDKWYADKDMHNMYMGEIKKILVKED